MAGGATNIATDIAILIFPVPIIWKLQIFRTQKLSILGVFLLGGLYILFPLLFLDITLLTSVVYWLFPLSVYWQLRKHMETLMLHVRNYTALFSFKANGDVKGLLFHLRSGLPSKWTLLYSAPVSHAWGLCFAFYLASLYTMGQMKAIWTSGVSGLGVGFIRGGGLVWEQSRLDTITTTTRAFCGWEIFQKTPLGMDQRLWSRQLGWNFRNWIRLY